MAVRHTSRLDFSSRKALCLSMGIYSLEGGATHCLEIQKCFIIAQTLINNFSALQQF